METVLRYGVIAAFFISAVVLTFLVLKTLSFGKRSLNAAPRGNWKKGVFYAFGQGMMPWEKESAKNHLLTYMAGFCYHFGIFAALVYLLSLVIPFACGKRVINILQVLMASGAVCGLGLLLKRSLKQFMRSLSCPDDFIANLLVDLFIVLSFLNSSLINLKPILFSVSILMLLYIPTGKIRHCFFFFYSRILFGHFFGRRGVFPRSQHQFKG